MATTINGSDTKSGISFVLKAEPVEGDSGVRQCRDQEPSEKQAAVEGLRGRGASSAAATGCPTSVKSELHAEADAPDYSVDIEVADVKQEGLARAEAVCAAGAGGFQLANENALLYNTSISCKNQRTTEIWGNNSVYSKSHNKHGAEPSRRIQSKKVSTVLQERDSIELRSFETIMSHAVKHIHACEECGKTFTRTNRLNAHRALHTGEKPYICQECGKSFAQLSYLKKHERIHIGKKLHTCQECGKYFRCTRDLNSHKIIHTGEKPYTCQECGKSFGNKNSFYSHRKGHTGERPHECLECGKFFRQKMALNIHKIIHTGKKPFPCQECGKSFRRRSNLYNHKQIHTGVRPHRCHDCGKCFARISHLNNHSTIHTGEKPHSCQECGKSFRLQSSLRSHVTTAHTGESFITDAN